MVIERFGVERAPGTHASLARMPHRAQYHQIERQTARESQKRSELFVDIGKWSKEDLVSKSHTVTNSSQNQTYYKNAVNTVQTLTYPKTNRH